jgi:hypothetical protein
MKAWIPCFAGVVALGFGACTNGPGKQVRRAEPAPEKWTIRIYTSPPNGLVDWNGNVLGVAPVPLTFRPDTTYGGRPVWPENGSHSQILRARWPDGCRNAEIFSNSQTPPQVVAIVSPNAHLYPKTELKSVP